MTHEPDNTERDPALDRRVARTFDRVATGRSWTPRSSPPRIARWAAAAGSAGKPPRGDQPAALVDAAGRRRDDRRHRGRHPADHAARSNPSTYAVGERHAGAPAHRANSCAIRRPGAKQDRCRTAEAASGRSHRRRAAQRPPSATSARNAARTPAAAARKRGDARGRRSRAAPQPRRIRRNAADCRCRRRNSRRQPLGAPADFARGTASQFPADRSDGLAGRCAVNAAPQPPSCGQSEGRHRRERGPPSPRRRPQWRPAPTHASATQHAQTKTRRLPCRAGGRPVRCALGRSAAEARQHGAAKARRHRRADRAHPQIARRGQARGRGEGTRRAARRRAGCRRAPPAANCARGRRRSSRDCHERRRRRAGDAAAAPRNAAGPKTAAARAACTASTWSTTSR